MPTTCLAQATGGGKKIQCWTDDHGVRACGDHVPPQYAKGGHQTVDSLGKTVQVVPRERTAAEQQVYDQQQLELKRAEEAKRLQAANDSFLLQAYQNVGEIEKARDERVAAIDGRILLGEKLHASTTAQLDDLRGRVAELKTAEKPVPADLAKQVQSFEDARAASDAAQMRLRQEREQTLTKYTQDVTRYRQLRGLPPL